MKAVNPGRVLVIEEQMVNAQTVRAALAGGGLGCEFIKSAAAAVELVLGSDFDAVVASDGIGREFLLRIRRDGSAIPVVITEADGGSARVGEAFRWGAYAVLNAGAPLTSVTQVVTEAVKHGRTLMKQHLKHEKAKALLSKVTASSEGRLSEVSLKALRKQMINGSRVRG